MEPELTLEIAEGIIDLMLSVPHINENSRAAVAYKYLGELADSYKHYHDLASVEEFPNGEFFGDEQFVVIQ